MDSQLHRLVIVTQSPAPIKKDRSRSDLNRRGISGDLIDVINDGLYFFEQDLKGKRVSINIIAIYDGV